MKITVSECDIPNSSLPDSCMQRLLPRLADLVKVTTPCQLKESDKTKEGRISGLHQSMVMSLCAGKLTDGLIYTPLKG